MKKPLPKVGEIWVRKPDPRDTVQFRRRVRVTQVLEEYRGVYWQLVKREHGQRDTGSCTLPTWRRNYELEAGHEQD